MARFILSDLLPFVLFPSLILLHLFIAPYTKVEESFNIQATHDIISYGIPPEHNPTEFLKANYDHFEFPGVVPRTFVGALVLSGLARPFKGIVQGFDRQLLVRAILGLSNAAALIYYAVGVRKAFGRAVGIWYTLFQASQFHIMYYASRTLPNMFAFGLTTVALRNFLPIPSVATDPSVATKRYRLALYLLTLTGIIFRSEVAILLFTVTVTLLFRSNSPQNTIKSIIIPAGLGGGLLGLLITIPIDSYFWQRFPLWPELAAFTYNVLDNNASNWGISPWYTYFTNSLPRLFMNPLGLQILAPLTMGVPSLRQQALPILIPAFHYILMYSYQPHKEWRFIIYALPPLTVTIFALPGSWMFQRRSKALFYRVVSFLLVLSVASSYVAQTGMLVISSLNYPGAVALSRVHTLAPHYSPDKRIVSVHMDTLSCTTGISRFLEIPPPATMIGDGARNATLWIYDKTESEKKKQDPIFWERFDYVIAERPEKVLGKWELLEVVEGFKSVRIMRPGDAFPPLKHADSGGVIAQSYYQLADWARRNITKGWWLGIRMEPMLSILKAGAGQHGLGFPTYTAN
ncbi:MAG: dolichyl-P-Man:Man(7)GlcNAc(2)-PP-dolichol alpha-1,6-mannosyltransferase [Cirrosporium novae-zelandiae]|nr:MAG: dolichyl-P-Man:Man(7)GlcNAc(2)-PP-dolichol alpha-1,6-mannosyltransferase [Cirrosporium novae-zelandiae]